MRQPYEYLILASIFVFVVPSVSVAAAVLYTELRYRLAKRRFYFG